MALKTIPSKIKKVDQSRATPLPSAGGVGRTFYSSPEWQSFRSAVIKERGRRCEKCGAVGTVICDHVVEVRDGGAIYERRNIQLLCIPCHNTKTAEAARHRSKTR